jgi:hypothetical protein
MEYNKLNRHKVKWLAHTWKQEVGSSTLPLTTKINILKKILRLGRYENIFICN